MVRPLPLVALLLAAAPGPVVVDRIVSVVGERVVTASDLRLEAALAPRDPSPVRALELRRHNDPLAFLEDLALLRGAAGDTALYRPAPAEVEARLARLRATFEGGAAWAAFLAEQGLDEDRLAGVLFSRMVAERYARRNGPRLPAGAGDDEVRAAWERWIAGLRAASPPHRVGEPAP